jgi:hypothetical protein
MQNKNFTLDRRVPLALVLALFLQATGAVWWASSKETQDHFRDRRLAGIERHNSVSTDRQVEILERLSRLEAQGEGMAAGLKRIEARLMKNGQ